MIDHHLPVGRHKGKPLADVPKDYLGWALRTIELSTGLRAAVRAELTRRGVVLTPEPPPRPRPPCRRCGCTAFRMTWQEQRGGTKAIRSECQRCGARCGVAPLTAENVAAANAVQPEAGLLDALVLAEEEGCELVPEGGRVEVQPWQRASRKLRELVRQSQHALLRHLTGEGLCLNTWAARSMSCGSSRGGSACRRSCGCGRFSSPCSAPTTSAAPAAAT